ncbi:MAG: hypothetical protein WBA74_14790, partial [Cyclobacteriaceae bacterium]
MAQITSSGCNQGPVTRSASSPEEAILGNVYSEESTIFRVWSPIADQMILRLYEDGHTDSQVASYEMTNKSDVWEISLPGNLHQTYYTYQATIDGIKMDEVTDPYAKAVGLNGMR